MGEKGESKCPALDNDGCLSLFYAHYCHGYLSHALSTRVLQPATPLGTMTLGLDIDQSSHGPRQGLA